MKKALFSSLAALALFATAFTAPSNPLVGRWQHKLPGGDTMLANFRPDGTYDVFVNNKTFVSGKYWVKQDVFALSDGHCNMSYFGTYKLGFYSGTDSIRFTLVQDSCSSRRQGTNGLTMGRVKLVKP
jgi:hypothetical protein